MSPVIEASRALLFSLVLLYLAGMFVCAGWALWKLVTRQTILPQTPLVPTGPTPWGLGTIWLVLVVAVISHLAVARVYSSVTGMAIEVPGEGEVTPVPVHEKPGADDAHAEEPKPAKRNRATEIEQLGLMAAGNFVLLLVLPGLLRLRTQRPLRDLGISLNRWPTQVLYGVVGMLVATPVVYGFQAGAVWVMKQTGTEPAKHKVQELLEGQFSIGMVLLTLVTTDILAPIVEEVMFRGLLQRWLIRSFNDNSRRLSRRPAKRAGQISPPESIGEPQPNPVTTVDDPLSSEPASNNDEVSDVMNEEKEPLFEAEATPAAVGTRFGTAAAIVATALIFGAVHAPAWPAPIAIFVLAIAMGILYERTGSLLTTIAMHGAFNGLGTITMFFQLLMAQDDKKPLDIIPPAVHSSLAKARHWPVETENDRPRVVFRRDRW